MGTSLDDAALVQAPLTGASPLRLGADLLARAEGLPTGALLDAPVTAVRHRLLAAHAGRFGSQIGALADCPACEETLEVALEVASVLAASAEALAAVTVTLGDGTIVTARVPTVGDVLDAAAGDPGQAVARLCALACGRELCPGDTERVDAALGAADPLAGGVALRCPGCAEEWTGQLDAFAYVVAELADDQRRVLEDVHVLAGAYGWDEAAVAAIPAWRRAHYRERIER